jgi:Ca2+-binding EF-hand superfamily protein
VPTNSGATLLDKNAFIEFINCPGIVSDRLFALASNGNKEERIEQANFVKLMLEIYSSDIDGKMNLVFKVFDFDGDGKISSEDVRMILSYIPRSRD